MEKAKIFINGCSQAVRLPKKYRFETDLLNEPAFKIILLCISFLTGAAIIYVLARKVYIGGKSRLSIHHLLL